MDWPWVVRDLTEAEKAHRRILLDRYGLYAQLSALIPIAAYWLFRLGVWVFHERQRAKPAYSAVPGSPVLKKLKATKTGSIAAMWRSFVWWLGGENLFGYGKRIHLLAGLAWAAWLLFLSVHRTGDDYFHVTKRFGIIAVSQFPLHYALIMKHRLSPLGILFRASHEELNPFHRALGRVIFLLISLHAGFYLIFFARAGLLATKLSQTIPLLGLLAFSLLNILGTTSLDPIRAWNYRLFFIAHMTIGITIIPLLFFHAAPLRPYILEALSLFLLDILIRRRAFLIIPTHIATIPTTNLLHLTIPLPASSVPSFSTPGQHIYLSLPPSSRPSHALIHELCFNPYTIASASPTSITLIPRLLSGPTSTALHRLASLSKANPPLQLDGPYGASAHFPDFANDYDRVLIVAGGVGATAVLPIYRGVRAKLAEAGGSANKARMLWAVRSKAETGWAGDVVGEGVEVFVTGEGGGEGEGVELGELGGAGAVRSGRPDLTRTVDEMFRHGGGERVAVLVCGPRGMGREVRGAVGKWVKRGREVWWHEEGFGW